MIRKDFSPWVFTTYGGTCNCPYCMVPLHNSVSIKTNLLIFFKSMVQKESCPERKDSPFA
jgi:hypothetical protein